jgi:gliding motility-associated-like protein
LIGGTPNFTMSADMTRGCDSLAVNFTSTLLVSQVVFYTWTMDDQLKKYGPNVYQSFDKPGFYKINLTIKNSLSGCTNSFTIDSMISVYSTPKTAINIDTEKCYSDQVLLTFPGHSDSTFYRWEFGGNVLSGFQYDSVLMIIDKPTEPVKLTVTEFGCTGKTVEEKVTRKPRFDFSVDPNEGCQPLFVQAEAFTDDPFVSFYWIKDSEPYPGKIERYFFPDSGRFDIALIARSTETGCFDTLVKPGVVQVNLKPRAKFEPNYTIAMTDNSTITFTNYSNNANSYFWNFADGETSTEFSPVHQYDSVGIFEVVQIVSNSWGCTDTFQLSVTIIPAVNYLPNAFRPNSEITENQTFMPAGSATTDEEFVLKIFNRLGDLVFESDSPLKPWDGKVKNGNDAPMGNYLWITTYTDIQGIKRSEKGQVLLIR